MILVYNQFELNYCLLVQAHVYCPNIDDILLLEKDFLQKYGSLYNIVCALCRRQADIGLVSSDALHKQFVYFS